MGFTKNGWTKPYLDWLFAQMDKWSETSELLNVRAFNLDIWTENFIASAIVDVSLLVTSLFLIYTYSFLVLGNCSPIHLRIISAFVGLCCVGISITAGYGMSFLAGFKFTEIHSVIPFLILGLGVDDMFVIVNSID